MDQSVYDSIDDIISVLNHKGSINELPTTKTKEPIKSRPNNNDSNNYEAKNNRSFSGLIDRRDTFNPYDYGVEEISNILNDKVLYNFQSSSTNNNQSNTNNIQTGDKKNKQNQSKTKSNTTYLPPIINKREPSTKNDNPIQLENKISKLYFSTKPKNLSINDSGNTALTINSNYNQNNNNNNNIRQRINTEMQAKHQQDHSHNSNYNNTNTKLPLIDSSINITQYPRPTNSQMNNSGISNTNLIRYMKFKSFSGDFTKPLEPQPDRGYYFRFSNGEIRLIRYILEDNGFNDAFGYEFTIFWSIGPIKNELYQCLNNYQKVNHFPKSHEITRKDSMHRNISKMQATYGLKNFNFIPRSFILPAESPLLIADSEKNKGMWYIIKPQASSQGKGIFITDKIDEILQKQNCSIIVSHYINDPYLIDGLKFDLRIYVAITSIHPLRIYIYEEGLTRFATIPYCKDNNSKANRFMHLTNYSINKYSETFVHNENPENDHQGSKWSLTAFKNFLISHGENVDLLFSQIEDIVVKTILSAESIMFNNFITQVPFRSNCFEILGFDILIDSQLKPWLLEVNLSPSLACDAPIDQKIKGEMIADLFTLMGVLPLDQRGYLENAYLKNSTMNTYNLLAPNFDKKPTNNPTTCGYETKLNTEDFSKEEKVIIKETNDEYERRGKFKRIYPNEKVNEYKNFFEKERPYNKVLRKLIAQNLNALRTNAQQGSKQNDIDFSKFTKKK